ncbi:MAG: ATP-binding protein [Acidobacteriota bacterium]|nr:ATP-binding protein [Acidobacteriota bacterium]
MSEIRRGLLNIWRLVAPYAWGTIGVVALTGLCFYWQVHSTTAALLYLTVIVPTALKAGRAPSAFVAVLAYLCLDSFFTAPLFRPAMNQPLDVAAPVAFLTTAFVVNRLATNNRRSFREIQTLKDQLRLVMDTIPGLVWSEAPDGSVEFLNQRWRDFLGATPTAAMDLQQRLPVHPAEAAALTEQWRQARQTARPLETEVRVRRADGVYRRLRLHLVPACEPSGTVVKWYGLGTDVEDWRQAEEALSRLQDELTQVARRTLLGELAASIAHEINQPLSAIVTNAAACRRWLTAQPPNLDEVRATVESIIQDSHRAANIITRIRAMFQCTEPMQMQFDIQQAVIEVIRLVKDELTEQGVALQTHFAPNLPPVFGDRIQCQQVLLNLLTNALDAVRPVTERPREIQLHIQPYDTDQVLVTVQDNGVGLEGVNVRALFDAFYTTKPGGMGMGLAISRSIVENHGGRLWAAANAGPGARFQFTLPTQPGRP